MQTARMKASAPMADRYDFDLSPPLPFYRSFRVYTRTLGGGPTYTDTPQDLTGWTFSAQLRDASGYDEDTTPPSTAELLATFTIAPISPQTGSNEGRVEMSLSEGDMATLPEFERGYYDVLARNDAGTLMPNVYLRGFARYLPTTSEAPDA